MNLHLIKLSVGTEDVADLERYQTQRLRQLGRIVHFTRMMPKRRDELLDGGSIYWVIRGFVRARQGLIGIERERDREGRGITALVLDRRLVRTYPRAWRPFQGWRYLDPEKAPPDIAQGAEDLADMPPEMLAELRSLGLV